MGAAAHVGTHTEHRVVRKIQQKSHRHAALRFRTSAPSAPAKSIVYVTRPRAKCRRWVMLCAIRSDFDVASDELCARAGSPAIPRTITKILADTKRRSMSVPPCREYFATTISNL